MTAPMLETARLVLRKPDERDLPFWMPFVMSDRAAFVRSQEPTEANGWRALAGIIGHWTLRGYGTLAFALKSKPDVTLGMTGPWNPHGWPEAELGWTLWSADNEGKGYVREAAEAARAWAYRDLGWQTAVSYIDPRNTRSIRLAERLGAVPDWDAATPHGEQCVVFRHPSKEALQ
ncbi:MAG: GNAT family N-acetyltransferase [Pseudomonadota bacterium]